MSAGGGYTTVGDLLRFADALTGNVTALVNGDSGASRLVQWVRERLPK